jgi:hypothetical protein
MHPASTASLRVASSSFAVMKMTGHFVPMPQVGAAARSPKFRRGGCRAAGMLPSARCRSRARLQLRRTSSFPCHCAPTAAPRPSESPHCHQLQSRLSAALPIRVQAPVRYVGRVVATLDLDQRNLVRCEQILLQKSADRRRGRAGAFFEGFRCHPLDGAGKREVIQTIDRISDALSVDDVGRHIPGRYVDRRYGCAALSICPAGCGARDAAQG